jgi:hypothetical protein
MKSESDEMQKLIGFVEWRCRDFPRLNGMAYGYLLGVIDILYIIARHPK